MSNPPPLSQMRAQFEDLMNSGWATPSRISRLSGTVDGSGHVKGTYATKSSGEKLWIQAATGRSRIDTVNLDDETTHLAYQKHDGFAMLPKDRVLPSGATYVFDVIRAHVFETHRMAELKQDLRT